MKHALYRTRLLPLCAAAIVGLLKCAADPVANGGSGSTTTNGITAAIYQPGGAPAIGAVVKIRAASFLEKIPQGSAITARMLCDTVTDNQGRFLIPAMDRGDYRIEINDGAGAVLLDCTLPGGGDTITLPDDTIRLYAKVFGNIELAILGSGNLFLQIYGMERLIPIDSTGHFEANDLPAGTHSFRIAAAAGSSFVPFDVHSVTVGPGDSSSIPFVQWSRSMKIFLNTTASGADVAGMVTGFPVLLRLDAANFDFSRAQANGADIRFTKPDGVMLPFEIERWDPTGAQAEIWVRLDTILGNNSTQYFVMYCGNSSASPAAAPAAVFDTANGFQGVWHLAEAQGMVVKDASGNHYDGIPYNTAAVTAAAGAIGQAQKFDGISSSIAMPYTGDGKLDFPQYGTYSISAWVYADTVDSTCRVVVSKGDYNYYMQIGNLSTWGFLDFQEGAGLEKVYSPACGCWSYLNAVRFGTKQYLYVNGVCTDSTTTLFTSDSARSTVHDFMIGKSPTAFPSHTFLGIIDEVRVSNVAQGAGWVRLCYMNQKPQGALVVFDNK